jgi:Family of unknown function (DUF6529)
MCSPCRGAPTHPSTALAVIPSPRFIHRRGLKGSAEDGAVQLANKANTSRLDGELHGGEVTGTLLLKQATAVHRRGGGPTGWALRLSGRGRSQQLDHRCKRRVTGVQRKADGSTAPAPPLSTDGTAVVNGKTITAIQLLSALIMYGRIPGVGAPSWIGPVHVWSGRLAVLVSVPVAVHCLYALGFQSSDRRVLVHAVLGCLFYGVFVTKMLLLTVRRVWPFPSQACSS